MLRFTHGVTTDTAHLIRLDRFFEAAAAAHGTASILCRFLAKSLSGIKATQVSESLNRLAFALLCRFAQGFGQILPNVSLTANVFSEACLVSRAISSSG
jgi:hypothetical protein